MCKDKANNAYAGSVGYSYIVPLSSIKLKKLSFAIFQAFVTFIIPFMIPIRRNYLQLYHRLIPNLLNAPNVVECNKLVINII
jgi:hypothetical protein